VASALAASPPGGRRCCPQCNPGRSVSPLPGWGQRATRIRLLRHLLTAASKCAGVARRSSAPEPGLPGRASRCSRATSGVQAYPDPEVSGARTAWSQFYESVSAVVYGQT
jgi:hypothetical protein